MNKMINLIRNENMKLAHSISTWIMMGILVLSIVAAGLILKFGNTEAPKSDWKEDITSQNQAIKEQLAHSQYRNASNRKGPLENEVTN